MADLPESETYDAGVYQIEVTDPVVGGVSGIANLGAKNLANRTKWLKAAYDALATAVGLRAPIASPTFTGTPAGPTPAAGTSSTALATTEFASYLNRGVLSKDVAGASNVSLSSVEAGAGIFLLTGVITADIAVIVPNAWRGMVQNNTTGAFAVTVKTAAGSGIVVPQTKARALASDGTNVFDPDTGLSAIFALLSGATFSGENVHGGNLITHSVLKRTGEARAAPTITAGVLTLDLATANVFDVALNGVVSNFTFSNPFASGTAHGFSLVFTADGTARAVTWPATVKWPGGVSPSLTSTNAKKDVFTFFTMDGGTTWLGFIAGQNL